MEVNSILQHWLTPAGALIILGAIVWGVQLNVAVMRLTTTLGRHQMKMDQQEKECNEYGRQLQRISIILDNVEKRMEGFERYKTDHDYEAGKCKERLVSVEEKVKNHSGQ